MSLTTAQLQALQTDATVTNAATVYQGETLGARWAASDTAPLAYYNSLSTTPIWRKNSIDALMVAVVWADYVALTPNGSLKQSAFLAMTQGTELDFQLQSIRDAIQAIFGVGSATLTNLLAVAKRNGTQLEILLASAVVQGARVSQVYEYQLQAADVAAARLV